MSASKRTEPARAWLLGALSGGARALGAMEIALTLGLGDATRVSDTTFRVGALAVGLALTNTRAMRVLWATAIALSALLLAVMFTPLVERPARALVRADPVGPPAQVVVVFSGSFTDAGHIGDIALTRLVSALQDARRLGIPELVVSVQERTVDGAQQSTLADQTALVEQLGGGVRLHSVRGVSNTYNESLAFAALARTHGWQQVRAVTSPLHTRRACAALETTGLRVTCVPSTSRDIDLAHLTRADARLRVARAAIHEYVGTQYYRWRGWF